MNSIKVIMRIKMLILCTGLVYWSGCYRGIEKRGTYTNIYKIPKHMKAITINRPGSRYVLKKSYLPVPSPRAKEVLVKVKATAVNPMDWKVRESGCISSEKKLSYPAVLGLDIAGEVAVLGDGVEDFKIGDRVFGYINMDKMGGYGEYATVNESELALMPQNIDFIKAASLPVAGITAAEGILDFADIQPGQLVLVHAAAGGVGSIAVQLAKVRGAKVIGTASKHNHEFLKDLGVDIAIDYHSQKFEDCVKNVDVVFDGVGGETQERSYKVLRKGGILVSITTVPDTHLAKLYSVKASHVWANPSRRLLNSISELVESGLVKPVVTYTFPLELY